VRVLLWHVHGSWTTSLVQGRHDYLLPVDARRTPDGLGRARTWDWPASAVEVPPEDLADEDVDVVVLQRDHELALAERWLGRRPGRDVPAVYVEHNTPGGPAVTTTHPLAGQTSIRLVHVTHFNRLVWDSGRAPTTVVEHGIPDPGHLYTGELPCSSVVLNDPVRRGRAVGADLLDDLARAAPLQVFGMRVTPLQGTVARGRLRVHEDLPQAQMHQELARSRLYVHTARWTSLGLSLLEAMQIGMPVVAVAATEVPRAVPPDAGCVSADPAELRRAISRFIDDPEAAMEAGSAARRSALERYGLGRFLADWDAVLDQAVAPG
jgi:glycosyltransferase involved in cell wall biosynthesis